MTAPARPSAKASSLDLAAILICTLCWGTTWFAITLQLGVVDPIASLVYRFAIAAVLLLAWCVLRREPIGLTAPQHAAAFGIGVFTFAVDYAFVYWAEERVTSAVVAVMFASLAFVNLIVFGLVFRQRAPLASWAAAALGIIGVACLSWEELAAAQFDLRAAHGIGLALAAVVGASFGNVFARNGELAGAPVAASTAWAMFYGSLLLALFALATGREWRFELTSAYLLSLLHLSLNGSVIAFLLYYGLARRRGYVTASYISALAPPVAMLVSALFEGKSWGVLALGGVALVLGGQWLLLRTRSA